MTRDLTTGETLAGRIEKVQFQAEEPLIVCFSERLGGSSEQLRSGGLSLGGSLATVGLADLDWRSCAESIEPVAEALGRLVMGTRLILATGPDWACLLEEAAMVGGFDLGMIERSEEGDSSLRIYCAPCSSVVCQTELAKGQRRLQCISCGSWIEVSGHYSRRLRAYLAVGVPMLVDERQALVAGPKSMAKT